VTDDRLPLPPFSAHTLTHDGYTVVVEARVGGIRRVRVYNPDGDVVDEAAFGGSIDTHRKARWMLTSAIESGE
jgi:hypothetical protein